MLIVNAVVGILNNDAFSLATRRKFNQQSILRECVADELKEFYLTNGKDLCDSQSGLAIYDVVGTISVSHHWSNLTALRQELGRSVPYKSRVKYFNIVDILLEHSSFKRFKFDVKEAINELVKRVLNTVNPSRYKETVNQDIDASGDTNRPLLRIFSPLNAGNNCDDTDDNLNKDDKKTLERNVIEQLSVLSNSTKETSSVQHNEGCNTVRLNTVEGEKSNFVDSRGRKKRTVHQYLAMTETENVTRSYSSINDNLLPITKKLRTINNRALPTSAKSNNKSNYKKKKGGIGGNRNKNTTVKGKRVNSFSLQPADTPVILATKITTTLSSSPSGLLASEYQFDVHSVFNDSYNSNVIVDCSSTARLLEPSSSSSSSILIQPPCSSTAALSLQDSSNCDNNVDRDCITYKYCSLEMNNDGDNLGINVDNHVVNSSSYSSNNKYYSVMAAAAVEEERYSPHPWELLDEVTATTTAAACRDTAATSSSSATATNEAFYSYQKQQQQHQQLLQCDDHTITLEPTITPSTSLCCLPFAVTTTNNSMNRINNMKPIYQFTSIQDNNDKNHKKVSSDVYSQLTNVTSSLINSESNSTEQYIISAIATDKIDILDSNSSSSLQANRSAVSCKDLNSSSLLVSTETKETTTTSTIAPAFNGSLLSISPSSAVFRSSPTPSEPAATIIPSLLHVTLPRSLPPFPCFSSNPSPRASYKNNNNNNNDHSDANISTDNNNSCSVTQVNKHHRSYGISNKANIDYYCCNTYFY